MRKYPEEERVLPDLINADDVAKWLRKSRKAVYVMAERGQLPAPHRVGRRLLWRREALVTWFERVSLTGDQR